MCHAETLQRVDRRIHDRGRDPDAAGLAYSLGAQMIERARRLDLAEQKLRFVIKSLLRAEGVSLGAYQLQFGSLLADDLPQLRELQALGLTSETAGCLRLSDEGLTWSDTIGPWLYSDAVTEKMAEYELA